MKILIVDDDPLLLQVLEHAIVRLGHEVTSAGSGPEALRLMRSGSYRIVICDWEMPEMDGLDLCRRIRERYCSKYVYIILLSVRWARRTLLTPSVPAPTSSSASRSTRRNSMFAFAPGSEFWLWRVAR